MRILIINQQHRAFQNPKALWKAWYSICRMYEAGNVSHAFHLLEEFQPDMFLVDVRMPDNSGLQAIRSIKAKIPSLQMLVLALDPNLKARVLPAGADVFVSKNDPPEMLWDAISMIWCKKPGTWPG